MIWACLHVISVPERGTDRQGRSGRVPWNTEGCRRSGDVMSAGVARARGAGPVSGHRGGRSSTIVIVQVVRSLAFQI
jgi:hypothetical protein